MAAWQSEWPTSCTNCSPPQPSRPLPAGRTLRRRDHRSVAGDAERTGRAVNSKYASDRRTRQAPHPTRRPGLHGARHPAARHVRRSPGRVVRPAKWNLFAASEAPGTVKWNLMSDWRDTWDRQMEPFAAAGSLADDGLRPGGGDRGQGLTHQDGLRAHRMPAEGSAGAATRR